MPGTTRPRPRRRPRLPARLPRRPRHRRLQPVGEVGPEVVAQQVERHAVLRPARAGHRRHDRREVQLEQLVEGRAVARLAPQALRLRVALDQLDPLRRAAGQAQVGERLVVDREERGRRPELGAHVADRGPVGEGQARPGRRPANSTNAPTTPWPRSISVTTRTRSVAVEPFGSSPVSRTPDDLRHRLVERLAEQDRLGLDAADAVAEHAEGVDHRRVRVGPDERVREGDAVPVVDDRCQELQVDLVDDAGPGRHDPQVAERGLGPAQQLVALAVALVLALDVEGERAGRPEPVDLDGVVDDEVGRAPAG